MCLVLHTFEVLLLIRNRSLVLCVLAVPQYRDLKMDALTTVTQLNVVSMICAVKLSRGEFLNGIPLARLGLYSSLYCSVVDSAVKLSAYSGVACVYLPIMAVTLYMYSIHGQ